MSNLLSEREPKLVLPSWELMGNGHLDVGYNHQIYVEGWAGPESKPENPVTIHLHGGPGQGFGESHAMVHDPTERVVFIDQRASGLSTHQGSRLGLEANTTQHLIDDIDVVADRFDANRIHLVGGSWGSALALSYALTNPNRVDSMVLWGVFTGQKQYEDLPLSQEAREFASKEFARLLDAASLGEDDITYAGIVGSLVEQALQTTKDGDPTEDAKAAAIAFALYQMKLAEPVDPVDEPTQQLYGLINSGIIDDVPSNELFDMYQGMQEDRDILREAVVPLHYFKNGSFMTPELNVLEQATKLRGIHGRLQLISGAQDYNTPPQAARDIYSVASRAGVNAGLKIVDIAGHIRTDRRLLEAITKATSEINR